MFLLSKHIDKKKDSCYSCLCSAYGNRTRMPRLRILYPNRQMKAPSFLFCCAKVLLFFIMPYNLLLFLMQNFKLVRSGTSGQTVCSQPYYYECMDKKNRPLKSDLFFVCQSRGSWGIRTPGTVTRTAVQQTAGFSHSPKLPYRQTS